MVTLGCRLYKCLEVGTCVSIRNLLECALVEVIDEMVLAELIGPVVRALCALSCMGGCPKVSWRVRLQMISAQMLEMLCETRDNNLLR